MWCWCLVRSLEVSRKGFSTRLRIIRWQNQNDLRRAAPRIWTTSLRKGTRFRFRCFDIGHTPSTAGTFRKKFRKVPGKSPETLSELFLEFPSRVPLGSPKPYNSRHLRLPEHFQNSLPPSTAGDSSFFRSGSGEGLSELVMEFQALLGIFLIYRKPTPKPS